MAKKAYIPHDANARNSKKMLRLRQRLDPVKALAAYGLYWMLVERLRDEEDYVCERDYQMLAFDFRADAEFIREVVEDYDLFDLSEDGKTFTSHGLEERMAAMEKKSSAGRKGAAARWNEKEVEIGREMARNGKNMANADFANGTSDGINKIKENKINKNKCSSSSSSSYPSERKEEAEEEQEQILQIFFFKNYQSPENELQRIAAYNSGPAVRTKWVDMSPSEHVALAEMWKQENPEAGPRFSGAFLNAWREVIRELRQRDAPVDVRLAALSDCIRWEVLGDKCILHCPYSLYEWIEQPESPGVNSNLSFVKPYLWPLMQKTGSKYLAYETFKTQNHEHQP